MDKEPIVDSVQAREFKHGTYRHFKGGLYKTLCIAHDSEDISRELVVYQSVDKGYICARPLEMFAEEVDKPEHSYQGPRFTYMGK